ncbi:hypothetical protein DM860_016231 [Cuscuta australis]|uniref:Uncharacterized protein n=1 Tax=Cuscuta australis TaxID=267555 RepID=A0A328E6C2_9ASTE|nr:hypothetical protein DM860_016231 [Cuscuta australis]
MLKPVRRSPSLIADLPLPLDDLPLPQLSSSSSDAVFSACFGGKIGKRINIILRFFFTLVNLSFPQWLPLRLLACKLQRPTSVSASRKLFKPSPTSFGLNRGRSAAELKSLCLMSATKLPSQRFHSNPLKTQRMVTRAMSSSSDKEHLPGLPIDLRASRYGYLAALSASSYSYISLLKHFIPMINPGGASISLTYIASERIIPGYGGGGFSSAKAALEKEVGNVAAFLASPLASAMTGSVVYVDNGLNAMGVGVDSPVFKDLDIPKDQKNYETAKQQAAASP